MRRRRLRQGDPARRARRRLRRAGHRGRHRPRRARRGHARSSKGPSRLLVRGWNVDGARQRGGARSGARLPRDPRRRARRRPDAAGVRGRGRGRPAAGRWARLLGGHGRRDRARRRAGRRRRRAPGARDGVGARLPRQPERRRRGRRGARRVRLLPQGRGRSSACASAGRCTSCVGSTGIASSTKSMVDAVARLRARRPEVVAKSFEGVRSLVKNARLAIEAGDRFALGKLMDLNQMLLSGLFVSSPEIERMCALAREAGAHGREAHGRGRRRERRGARAVDGGGRRRCSRPGAPTASRASRRASRPRCAASAVAAAGVGAGEAAP